MNSESSDLSSESSEVSFEGPEASSAPSGLHLQLLYIYLRRILRSGGGERARGHRGGSGDAPGRLRGGSREAPSRQRCTERSRLRAPPASGKTPRAKTPPICNFGLCRTLVEHPICNLCLCRTLVEHQICNLCLCKTIAQGVITDNHTICNHPPPGKGGRRGGDYR